jgi:NADH dehydrogenase
MIAITGGTGFVGRRLAARLVQAGEQVRALARLPAHLPEVTVVQADVTGSPDSLANLLAGCQAVIHLVGIIRERGRETFHRVHVRGTHNVLRACKQAGVPRLLHMSALGARPNARSRYHRSKWKAEEMVRASGLAATIFRPSVIFGPGSAFLSQMRALVTGPPVIPIVGNGMSLLQPIWIEDVATCFLAALGNDQTIGHSYELGGPETYGFEQLLDLIAESAGIEKPKPHLPVWLVRLAATALSPLTPRFPLTADQLALLLEDNACDITEMRETFGLAPASLRAHLSE